MFLAVVATLSAWAVRVRHGNVIIYSGNCRQVLDL